jgi:hypothetical protein
MKETKTGFEPVLKPGDVKYGPFDDAVADAHGVQGTEVHTRSELCAWCHQYTNPEGTPILATYSEWKESKAAEEGQTCQSCHMGEASASATDPRLDRDPNAKINLHTSPGAHSLEQLHKALSVSLRPRRDGDNLDVEVEINNKGAGHAVPTGMPGRRVIMTTELRVVGGETYEATRVFGKTLENAAGDVITRDRDYFVPGVKLKSDTTIQADERRKVLFHYKVPARATAILNLKLFYEHTYSGAVGEKDRINFLSQKRTIRPSHCGSDGGSAVVDQLADVLNPVQVHQDRATVAIQRQELAAAQVEIVQSSPVSMWETSEESAADATPFGERDQDADLPGLRLVQVLDLIPPVVYLEHGDG